MITARLLASIFHFVTLGFHCSNKTESRVSDAEHTYNELGILGMVYINMSTTKVFGHKHFQAQILSKNLWIFHEKFSVKFVYGIELIELNVTKNITKY